MKNVTKMFGKLLLCVSISMYGLPAFANIESAEASKIELTDSAMESAVGGSMHAEILSNPAVGASGSVKALVAVGTNCCNLVYALEAVDLHGNVQRTLASGGISGNQAIVIDAEGLASDIIYRVRVDFSNANIPGLEAVDTVWRDFQ